MGFKAWKEKEGSIKVKRIRHPTEKKTVRGDQENISASDEEWSEGTWSLFQERRKSPG